MGRRHMSYLIYTAKKRNPGLPDIDESFEPTTLPGPEEMAAHTRRMGAVARGQIEELLTRYGRIDVLWFDGGLPQAELYPMERIRELQPGCTVNPRMHGYGDYKTHEYHFPTERPTGWWEFCTMWCIRHWGYVAGLPYRSTPEVLTELVKARAWGGNYLLNVGPMANGEFPQAALDGLTELESWLRVNGDSVWGVSALPAAESSTVPATTRGSKRYLHVLPDARAGLELTGAPRPRLVRWLDGGASIAYRYSGGVLSIDAGAIGSSGDVRVIEVDVAPR